jgi:pyrroline-5-carboxylate reductase
MSSTKIAFIGTGNMSSALAIATAKHESAEIILANRTEAKAYALAELIGASVADSNIEAAANADYIFLGVKPYQIREVAAEIAPHVKPHAVVISMAAGITTAALREALGKQTSIIRIMPNTPCAVGYGTILYTADKVPHSKTSHIIKLTAAAGEWIELPEGGIDAAGVLSGCGPAYAYEIMEAMADGGVLCGVPRALAYKLSARALLGAAELMLTTNKNPSELKDEVTSPGGSTIEGLRAMEKKAVRSAMIEAVAASYWRNKELGGEPTRH